MDAATTELTIGSRPTFATSLIAVEAYEAAWRQRKPGTRLRSPCYYYAVYASVFIEADNGVEVEVSALVDLPPGRAHVEDYRCHIVPDGPEVDLDERTLADLRDSLAVAATDLVR